MKAEKFFYKEGKWYHIKVVIDPEKNIFYCYVDNVKLEDIISMKGEKQIN